MSEEFLTEALADDRYIKADLLVNRFRDHVFDALEETTQQIIDTHPYLFVEDANLDSKHFGAEGRTMSTIRTESALSRSHEEYGSLKLNVGVEWVDPETQDATASEGESLCYVLYKIQRGFEADFEAVQRHTVESDTWDAIRFGEDQWPYQPKEAPGIVYIPITDGPEFMAGLETLQQHFSEIYAAEL